MKPSPLAAAAFWAAAVLTVFQPAFARADSIGPYGVNRVAMRIGDTGGRPHTFSESDIFACVQIKSERAAVYRVPYGYVTDQTSIPRQALSWLIGENRNPLFANAAIIHDYLYAAGDPGNASDRETADDVMIRLMRSEDVSEKTVRRMEQGFLALQKAYSWKVWLQGMQGWLGRLLRDWFEALPAAFGAPTEWERWANPYTLTLLDEGARPPPRLPLPIATTLPDCKVFDRWQDVDDRSHLPLHACLHSRFGTEEARPPLPVTLGVSRPWPSPRMPTALIDSAAEIALSHPPGASCDVFASTIRSAVVNGP